VRVQWVREVATNRWNVGCAFEQALSDQELTILLENKSATAVIDSGTRVDLSA
jgi:hypothetical protein